MDRDEFLAQLARAHAATGATSIQQTALSDTAILLVDQLLDSAQEARDARSAQEREQVYQRRLKALSAAREHVAAMLEGSDRNSRYNTPTADARLKMELEVAAWLEQQ